MQVIAGCQIFLQLPTNQVIRAGMINMVLESDTIRADCNKDQANEKEKNVEFNSESDKSDKKECCYYSVSIVGCGFFVLRFLKLST